MARAAPPLAVGEPERAVPTEQPRPLRRHSRSAWVVAVIIAGAALVVAFWRPFGGGPAPLTGGDVDRAVQRGIEQAKQDQRNTPPDAAAAYRTILPSLVTVTAERAATGGATGGTSGAGTGELGAGVVINARGAVLTALHVVEKGGQIRVRYADGTQTSARVANRQDASDIAVLAVDRLPQVVVPAVIGGGAQVGDAVFPVGNPLGLQGSLSAGVVSAIGRSVRTEAGGSLSELIQFDAAVNPGNSGGPLLNRDGQVIGIVTGLANPSQQAYFVGIGFAVPIATAGGVAGGPSK
jgi:S1-C subfamily serine protease